MRKAPNAPIAVEQGFMLNRNHEKRFTMNKLILCILFCGLVTSAILCNRGTPSASRRGLQTKRYDPSIEANRIIAERNAIKVHPDIQVIQQWQIHSPVPVGLLADSAYILCKKIGITSLQSYVGWAQLEPERNRITYDIYDPVVNQIRKHNLKWLPFIIMGPYIATPKWFREERGVDAVCLEHNKPIRIQSIWNSDLKPGVRRFLELFKTHYDPAVIEALELGISGNWGESIYPADGGFDMEGVHTHMGWWCGDRYAGIDLQRWVRNKYTTIGDLNRAWKSDYHSFDVIKPFMPQHAPSPRAAVDMGRWYMGAMTDYAEYWIKTARELFPSLPIYLCTGGSGTAALGADFSAQARMCAKYNAGIRITNMNDDMMRGFALTRMVSSAARLYGGYYSNEPAGDNTHKGIAGRVFDVVSGGGRGVYFKSLYLNQPKVTLAGLLFTDFAEYLKPNTPKLTVAALMPNSSIILKERTLYQFLDRTTKLRDILDFEFIDENMISDGLLQNFKAIVILSGNTLEASVLEMLKKWIKDGGVLFISMDSYPLHSIEGWKATWLQAPNAEKIPLKVSYFDGKLAGVKADIGGADGTLITGDWGQPLGIRGEPTEELPDPTYRWTTGKASISLPIPSKKPVILKVLLSVPDVISSSARISANGIEVAKLDAGNLMWINISIPETESETSEIMTITFESNTFIQQVENSHSPKQEVGIKVYMVQLMSKGAKPSKLVSAETVFPQVSFDEQKAYAKIANKLGKGYTVVWPEKWDSYKYMLSKAILTDKGPWEQLSEPLDGIYDNILVCRAGDSFYYYNNCDSPITKKISRKKSICIEPRTLVEVNVLDE
ncbi:MAG TPA: beta-galactosidase [bacterium]|nr:beta-galactosidase [bacterium]